MNTRVSGVIIAISAAVAGSLTPSTVEAYLEGRYVITTGLGVILALNAGIAALHIFDRGRTMSERIGDREQRAAAAAASSQRDGSSTGPVIVRRNRSGSPTPEEAATASLPPANS
jgi:hypothetical protein